jgi:acylphosphatase
VLGITGWVRNRMDESVEAMLQGSSEQLADMCNWLRDGMPAANFDKLDVLPRNVAALRECGRTQVHCHLLACCRGR